LTSLGLGSGLGIQNRGQLILSNRASTLKAIADVKKASFYLKPHIIACLHHQCTGHGLFMSTTLDYFISPVLGWHSRTTHKRRQAKKIRPAFCFLSQKPKSNVQNTFPLPHKFSDPSVYLRFLDYSSPKNQQNI
jgi:hypothetical protein